MASAVSNDLQIKKLMESQDRSSKHSQNQDLDNSSVDQKMTQNNSIINPMPVVRSSIINYDSGTRFSLRGSKSRFK